jgi:tight adherence protein B
MAFVLAAVFIGTVLLIAAGYVLVNRRQLIAADTLRSRLSPTATVGETARILRDDRTSEIGTLNRMLAGRDFTQFITTKLYQAGSRLSVGEFVLMTIVFGGLGALLGNRMGFLGVPMLGIVAGSLPYLNLRRQASSRLKLFQAQLPEAIDMVVNAMKSGYSLQAAIKFAGDEMPQPLGPEFARVYDEQRLGMDLRNALLGLQERVDSLDCRMFVTALLLQRETGGNLAEILSNIAALMRERVGVRGEIDTLTAEPKLSAVVLALLPLVLFIVISSTNRTYMAPLWTTPLGRLLLMYGIGSVIFGYIVLRKIGQIDI